MGTAAARARFRVGQPVAGRVLQVDAAARRITLTLKKTLAGAKLPPFTSWEVCPKFLLSTCVLLRCKLFMAIHGPSMP